MFFVQFLKPDVNKTIGIIFIINFKLLTYCSYKIIVHKLYQMLSFFKLNKNIPKVNDFYFEY